MTHRRMLVCSASPVALGAALTLAAGSGLAGPEGERFVAGAASVDRDGGLTVVDQDDPRAVIEWDSFDVSAGEEVLFNHPSSSAITLNRVTGDGGASLIDGTLRSRVGEVAGGQVWIINRRGVTLGPNASVDVGGLLLSSIDIADDDVMDGDDTFDFNQPGDPNARIVIQSGGDRSLNIAGSGLLGLIGPRVAQGDLIRASTSRVVVGGVEQIGIDLAGDDLIAFTAPVQSVAGDGPLVEIDGALETDGGAVWITADAASDLVEAAISISGDVETRGGAVEVSAPEGAVEIAGRIDTGSFDSDLPGPAGDIRISAREVALEREGALGSGDLDDAGDIFLTATESLFLAGDILYFGSSGADGAVTLDAPRLTVEAFFEDEGSPDTLLDLFDDGELAAFGESVETFTLDFDTAFDDAVFRIGAESAEADAAAQAVERGVDVFLTTRRGASSPDGAGPDDLPIVVAGGLGELSPEVAVALTLVGSEVSLESGGSGVAQGGGVPLSFVARATLGDVTVGAPIDVDGSVTLEAAGGVTATAAVASGAEVLARGASVVELSGGVTAEGEVTAVSTADALTVGDVEAGGEVAFEASGGVALLGDVNAGGFFTATSLGGDLVVRATLSAGDVTLDAPVGDVRLLADVSATDADGRLEATAGEIVEVRDAVLTAQDVFARAEDAFLFSSAALNATGEATFIGRDALELDGRLLTPPERLTLVRLDGDFLFGFGEDDVNLSALATEAPVLTVEARRGDVLLDAPVLAPDLDLTAIAEGAVRAAAPVEIGRLNATAGGEVLLDRAGSDFGRVSGEAGGRFTLADRDDVALGPIAAETLRVAAIGRVTQVAPLRAGEADIEGASVALLDAGNDFDTLSGSTDGAFEAVDADALELGAIRAASLSVETGGSITDAGLLDIAGAASFDAGEEADIVLDFSEEGARHRFAGALSVNSEDTFIQAEGPVSLGRVTTRLTSFDPTFNQVEGYGDVYDDQRTFILRASGPVTQAEGSRLTTLQGEAVDGRMEITAGGGAADVILDGANRIDTLSVVGDDVLVRGAASVVDSAARRDFAVRGDDPVALSRVRAGAGGSGRLSVAAPDAVVDDVEAPELALEVRSAVVRDAVLGALMVDLTDRQPTEVAPNNGRLIVERASIDGSAGFDDPRALTLADVAFGRLGEARRIAAADALTLRRVEAPDHLVLRAAELALVGLRAASLDAQATTGDLRGGAPGATQEIVVERLALAPVEGPGERPTIDPRLLRLDEFSHTLDVDGFTRLAAAEGVDLPAQSVGEDRAGARIGGALTLAPGGGEAQGDVSLGVEGDLVALFEEDARIGDVTLTLDGGALTLLGPIGAADRRAGLVRIEGANDVTFAAVGGAAGDPAARLLEPDDGDLLFADRLEVIGFAGEVRVARTSAADAAWEAENAFFGLNLPGGLAYDPAGSALDVTGALGPELDRSQAAARFAEGPAGDEFQVNLCPAGAGCLRAPDPPSPPPPPRTLLDLIEPGGDGDEPGSPVFRFVFASPPMVDLDLNQLADVYASFGNEELWLPPAVFLRQDEEEDR